MVNSRKKGHDWEREVANKLKEIDPTAKRNLEYQEGSMDIGTQLPFAIQCKCMANPSVYFVFRQAKEGAKKVNKIPVAIIKRTNKETIAVMELEDWLKLVKEWHGKLNRTLS